LRNYEAIFAEGNCHIRPQRRAEVRAATATAFNTKIDDRNKRHLTALTA